MVMATFGGWGYDHQSIPLAGMTVPLLGWIPARSPVDPEEASVVNLPGKVQVLLGGERTKTI